MKQTYKLTLLIFFIGKSFAQDGYWKAKLENNTQTGYYKIMLNSGFLGKTDLDLANIRLIDKDSVLIPFEIKTENNAEIFTSLDTIPFEIKSIQKTKKTEVIIKNIADRNTLIMKFKNFDFDKSLEIFGSDNAKNWFGIKQNIVLDAKNNYTDKNVFYNLNFPNSAYKYLLFSFNDSISPKVNLLSIGTISSSEKEQIFDKIKCDKIKIIDSIKSKQTFYRFDFEQTYQFSYFNIEFDEKKLFKRFFRLYEINYDIKTKKEFLNYISESSFTNENYSLHFSPISSKSFVLVSENQDNLPLKIISIVGFQEKKSINTYLETGKEYFLISNPIYLQKPNFDLTLFQDSLTKNAQHLKMGNPEFVAFNKPNENQKENSPKWILWAVVLLAVGLLTFMSVKLLNEVKNRKYT